MVHQMMCGFLKVQVSALPGGGGTTGAESWDWLWREVSGYVTQGLPPAPSYGPQPCQSQDGTFRAAGEGKPLKGAGREKPLNLDSAGKKGSLVCVGGCPAQTTNCSSTPSVQQGEQQSWARLFCLLRGSNLFCYRHPKEAETQEEPALTIAINKVWGLRGEPRGWPAGPSPAFLGLSLRLLLKRLPTVPAVVKTALVLRLTQLRGQAGG